jgi:hypothetical protein
MPDLSQTDWEILNVTADDPESLEQIYLGVCFEIVQTDGGDNGLHLSYRRVQPVLLEEIANRVRHLVDLGLLRADSDENGQPLTDLQDLSYVRRAWFSMTSEGRRAWDESEFGNFVAQ